MKQQTANADKAAAHAAFTFQTVCPGIIPAEQGNAGNPLLIAQHTILDYYTPTPSEKEAFFLQKDA